LQSAVTALPSAPVREKQGVEGVAESAFRRHYGDVYRFVRRRTRDHHRAEELTQQVFADASASLRESSSPALAWLYTVAQRRFADEARRSRRERIGSAAEDGESSLAEYGQGVADALRRALARLPEAQRQLVVLRLLRGARFAEIGTLLGISEDAAKMRFVRALQAVRAELELEGIEP
jgi:RNA polymerase sigma factor (sigma-70 family)